MSKTCIKDSASPLRTFKQVVEVLWVFVGQLASMLKAVKVGGLTKSSVLRPELNQTSAARVRVPDDFDHLQCLMDCNFAAL